MAKCEKCGKNYYNGICPCILSNKKDAGGSFTLIKIWIIVIISICAIGIIGYLGINFLILKEENKKLSKELEEIKADKTRVEMSLFEKERLIKRYIKINNELMEKIKKNRISMSEKSDLRDIEKELEAKNKNIQSNKQSKRYEEIKKDKKYQSFSKNIKLVSDSKIIRYKNNKLHSNMPIKGRYYAKFNRGVYILNCDKNPKLYNVVNECTASIQNQDKVYFKKSNMNELLNFNIHSHMIECKYSKEHGIMHDCRAKLKS